MNHHSKYDLIDTESRLGAHNYKPPDVVLSRGEGVWVIKLAHGITIESGHSTPV